MYGWGDMMLIHYDSRCINNSTDLQTSANQCCLMLWAHSWQPNAVLGASNELRQKAHDYHVSVFRQGVLKVYSMKKSCVRGSQKGRCVQLQKEVAQPLSQRPHHKKILSHVKGMPQRYNFSRTAATAKRTCHTIRKKEASTVRCWLQQWTNP